MTRADSPESRLSVARLFASPPLSGTLPSALRFAPDGTFVAYLQAAGDDRQRLDLWRFDLPSGEHRCWLSAQALDAGGSVASAAEKAERERRRQFSTGISRFEFSPSGQLVLLVCDGHGHLLDVRTDSAHRFTSADSRQTGFHFSPRGRFISYVRDGDLCCYELATGRETFLTRDGSELVSSGIPEFIAAEEMHRFDGHWWSADERRIAYTRVDLSPIPVTERYEIDADAVTVVAQRYPYAGSANARVSLHVYDLETGSTTEVAWQHEPEDYLARVGWADERLAIQVQGRDQQTLHLDLLEPDSGTRRTLLTETSPTWINLHDNFRWLGGEQFLWTSERSGSAQLYRYQGTDGRQLTREPGRVAEILHHDKERVIYSGWRDSPTEQHAFRVAMAGGEPERLTPAPGWHEVVLGTDPAALIDRWSSLENMGEIRVLSAGSEQLLASDESNPSHPYRAFRPHHLTPTLGTLDAEDGQTLFYRLTRPASGGAHPLVVWVYGGPGAQRVRNEWAPLLLQLFAERGLGVLELDNRGSANRGRAFEAPIHRQLGAAEVRDQLSGVAKVAALDWVDGNRIGVFGHSYGGFMALMCLCAAPETFRAGVAVAPVTDWTLYDTHYTERYLSTPADNPDGYQASSVFPHLDRLQGRLLLMHGMADDNVLFTNTTRLIRDLQSRRQPFEMMVYPGAKHSLQEEDVSVHRFELILDFFERSL